MKKCNSRWGGKMGVVGFVFVSACVAMTAGNGVAANLTWDIASGDGGTITDGSGYWTHGGGNWNDGSGNVSWNNAAVDNAIIGSGGTAGTLTLGSSITAGTLNFGVASGSYTINIPGLSLAVNGISGSGTINNSIGNGTLTVGNGNASSSFGGTLTDSSGTLSLFKTGSGTFTLTGTLSTLSGPTTVSGGILALNAGQLYNGSWGPSAVTINNGAIVEVGGWADGDTASGKGLGKVLFNSQYLQFNGGTLRYTGSATSGQADRGFTIGVNGATLEAAGGNTFRISAERSNPIVNDPGGTLTLSGASNGQVDKVIPGTGKLVKSGSGTWTLTTNNTYSGNTEIMAGTLKAGRNGVIPSGSGKGDVVVLGKLDVAGFSVGVNGISGSGTIDNTAGNGTLTVGNNDASSTFGGTLTDTAGTLSFVKTGSGTFTLTNALSVFSGATTVSGGTLALNDGQLYNGGWASVTVTINNGAIVEVGGWADGDTVSGKGLGKVLFGSQCLQVDGGTVRYTGSVTSGNPYRGFTIGANGATFEAAGGNTFTISDYAPRPIVNEAGGRFTLSGASDGQIDKEIPGVGDVVKDGVGTWTLTASNSYSGGTLINAGTLVASNGGLGVGDVVVGAGGQLSVVGTGDAISDEARLYLEKDGGDYAKVELAAGVNDRVAAVYLDGVRQLGGVYGSSSSPAPVENQNDDYFSGTGVVSTPPGEVTVLIVR